MTFTVGETVGAYRIVSPLGQGGMATVYKAHHASLDRYVAIKVLHPAFKEDPTFLSRFQREARVLARLDHPNIVPIYDFAEHDGQPYLVMKYLEGQTLKDRLAAGPMPMAETLAVLEAVGSALAYAHQQGVLHRDIKPSNIIITPDNHYYLSDFGLARIAAAGESTLSQDTLLGTPNYISPEQAKGQTDLDGRADIYSLGVVLYEMIVGRVPFSGDTPYSVIHDHIYTPLPLPSAVNPEVPEALEKFLLKALAKGREERFANVSSLLLAFRKAVGLSETAKPATANSLANKTEAWPPATVMAAGHLETAPIVAASPKTDPARTVTAAKPNRLWWVVGGAALVVVCLGAIGLAALSRFGRENRTRATGTAATLATTTAMATVTAAPTPTPPTVPDPISNAKATLEAAPNSPEAILQLGQAYYAAGQLDDAAATYAKAAGMANYRAVFYTTNVLGPYNQDPIFELMVLSDGLQHAERRLQAELWLLTTPILEQAAALPNSEAVLVGMRTTFPDQPAPVLALAHHYILFNQVEQAGPLIDQVRKAYPDLPLGQYVYAEYLAAKGQQAEAQTEYEAVLSNPRSTPALRQAAQKALNTLKGTKTP